MSNKKFPEVEIRDNPFHAWARVELWRWQYGELPQDDDERELDVVSGIRKMAESLSDTNSRNLPTPFQVQKVLDYVADILDGKEALPGRPSKEEGSREANSRDDPLPFDELTEEEGQERCELCVHRRCFGGGGPDEVPPGPGPYCDDPFGG